MDAPRHYGGPLDGRPAQQFRGAWSTWHDEHGKHLPTRAADLTLLDRHVPLNERRAYLLDERGDGATAYVWLPSWRAWRRRDRTPTERTAAS